ncbi:TadE/TadG family type IV pilus assembly protein [Halomonas sp. NO4]|uniref:TadE family protein n=1 Tax=Halomonas sp. NO4 TaxID=2484813 RepID=UPI0013D71972|nr:TadE/TadG family type IV pilus assembly protein [Halomonas sp. NO4]
MKRARSLHKQQGAEVVEFAITSFALFLILFGVIELSVALYDKAVLTNASREGARTGILFRPMPRDLVAEDDAIEQAVKDYAEQYLISLGGPAEMTIDITRSDMNMTPGSDVTVTVDYPYKFLLLPGIVGELIEIQAVTSMRAE